MNILESDNLSCPYANRLKLENFWHPELEGEDNKYFQILALVEASCPVTKYPEPSVRGWIFMSCDIPSRKELKVKVMDLAK